MTKINDLKTPAFNPRRITPEQKADLLASLKKFGDLSGIVRNRTTGHLVGGNQRTGVLRGAEAKIKITETLKQPDACGTVARGYIDAHGTRYSYREVEWDEATEKQANIAANKLGGDWDEDKLGALMADMKAAGISLEGLGFTPLDLDQLLGTSAATAQARIKLAERFMVPPFTVLSAREGWWQQRKAAWIALGIKSELGRGAAPGGSRMPAVNPATGKIARSDSRARPIEGTDARAPGGR